MKLIEGSMLLSESRLLEDLLLLINKLIKLADFTTLEVNIVQGNHLLRHGLIPKIQTM